MLALGQVVIVVLIAGRKAFLPSPRQRLLRLDLVLTVRLNDLAHLFHRLVLRILLQRGDGRHCAINAIQSTYLMLGPAHINVSVLFIVRLNCVSLDILAEILHYLDLRILLRRCIEVNYNFVIFDVCLILELFLLVLILLFSEHLDVFDVNTAFQGILSIFLLRRVRKITLIDLSFYYLIEWFHYVLVLWESGLFLNLGLSF